LRSHAFDQLDTSMPDKLPDLLKPGLRIVFCGFAAGAVSAARGAYYAGPGNRFWPILFETGLTSRRLRPDEFRLLPTFGIGLTDIVKSASGADAEIPAAAFDRERLITSIRAVQPACLAFNGKAAAAAFLRQPSKRIPYGPGPSLPDFPSIMVLPSTSGAASGFWDREPWFALARRFAQPTPLCSATPA
jgi:TDG/mug DNA glycosylase family protein